MQKKKGGNNYPKVFLGGLPSNITETDLRLFFSRYGKVMEIVIMYDQEKKKSRGNYNILFRFALSFQLMYRIVHIEVWLESSIIARTRMVFFNMNTLNFVYDIKNFIFT